MIVCAMPTPRSLIIADQVSITELKAQVPADAQDHDLLIEVPTLEQFFDRYESWHSPIVAECGCVCTRAPGGAVQLFLRR
jgi:hypothetical protein